MANETLKDLSSLAKVNYKMKKKEKIEENNMEDQESPLKALWIA